jgi:hypothetical protein
LWQFGVAKTPNYEEERPMSTDKYVGLDVHQSSTVSAVHNGEGMLDRTEDARLRGSPSKREDCGGREF